MRAWTLLGAAALALAVLTVPVLDADAGSKVEVRATYEISIAGWRIAQAKSSLTISGGRYDADIFMKPTGVARIVTAVRTTVASGGRLRGGRVLPSRYKVRSAETDRPVRVDMTLRGGDVASVRARPPLKARPGRVPVTSAHKRDIVDPLSSGLLPIRRADGRDACDHTLEIFDGWTRYDVRLHYKGTEEVSTEGFSGRVPVCGARWVPVAGHRPDKKEVRYLANNKRLEMAVLPLPNARVAIPYRVSIGTPNGEILIKPSRMQISGAGV